ncbi:TetR/AcrR family transcriptional regulator [Streptomyces sp. NPDC014846]|uniref:TetR/AcrR family transcriptional regulator n=1 Tax=Streptomyces sp. NPDC014846 TaxID=3364922 RepID=UPI0036F94952
MTKNRSGGGDPVRTLELLWRAGGAPEPPTGRRGPRQGLTVDAVVGTAVELADAEGLDALTMRALAQRLGVTPMTVYTYVPGKAELLDLMLDEVYGRMELTPFGPDEPWRGRVTRVAEDNRDLLVRHPWIAEMSVTRPPLGPGVIGKYEHELAAFEGIGLPDAERDAALTHLLGFVHSTARAAADAAELNSRQSDNDWWAEAGPLLAQVIDADRYPLAGRVGEAAGAYNPDVVWAFGLQCVLEGLERWAERQAGGAGRR